METLELFTNKVVIFDLDIDMGSLKDAVNKEVKEDPEGVQYSNIGGWHSNSIVENPAFEELLQVQNRCIEEYIKNYYSVKYGIMNSWININNIGDFNARHVHPASAVSGCFYLQAPAGAIVFEDPRNLDMLELYHISPENYRVFPVEPKEGQFVVFPSFLPHWVTPNTSSTSRISIATNYKIEPNYE